MLTNGQFLGGNRGIGFNRRTWQAGNALGRAARPYVRSVASGAAEAAGRVRRYLESRGQIRNARVSHRRSLRTNASVPTAGKQLPAAGGESKSYSTFKNPPIKMSPMEKQLPDNHVIRNNPASFTCSQAVQATGMLGRFFDVTDVQNCFATLQQPTATPGFNSGKIALLKIKSTIMITNSGNMNLHGTIYEVMARQDGSDVNPDPLTVYLAGGVDATGGTANDALIPGYTPYQNPRFVSAYKILKSTPLIFSAGQTHVHRITYDLNKIVSRERTITSDLSGPLGGITIYSFIIFHGTPTHEALAETTVSTAACKLDMVASESLDFKMLYVNFSSTSATNSLTVLTTPEQWATDAPTDTAAST